MQDYRALPLQNLDGARPGGAARAWPDEDVRRPARFDARLGDEPTDETGRADDENPARG